MARCKIQAQKCRFSEAEIEDRLIEQLIIGTREPEVQEALLGKDDKLKLDKAIDIARERETTVNDMKSLEQQGASASGRETNIDAIRQNQNPQCGKCGLNHEENVQPKAQDAGIVINGTTGNKHAERNRQRTGETNHDFDHHLKTGHHVQDKSNQRRINVVEESNPDLDEL